MEKKSMPTVHDREGKPIVEGDKVYTRIRGGSHEGTVDNIAYTLEDAEEQNVKNPPKVIFESQRGKRVSHNPGTLTVDDDDAKKQER